MKYSLNQKGSAFVIIIIVATVLIVAGLGYIVWDRFIASTDTLRETGESRTTETVEGGVDPYEGWSSYNSEADGYSLRYPSEWIVSTDGPYFRNFDPATKTDAPRQEATNYPEGFVKLELYIDEDDANFANQSGGLSTTEWYERLGVSDAMKGAGTYDPNSVKLMTVGDYDAKSVKVSFSEVNEDIFILSDSTLYNFKLFPYGVSSDETVKLILDSFVID